MLAYDYLVPRSLLDDADLLLLVHLDLGRPPRSRRRGACSPQARSAMTSSPHSNSGLSHSASALDIDEAGASLAPAGKRGGDALSAQAYERKSGWVTFAAIVMFSVAFFRIISAISYFNDSSEVADLTRGLFGGTLWTWAIWDLCIAALAVFAGISLLGNGGFGRVAAYAWAVVAIVNSFAIINLAPWYAAITIGLAALVVYGLTTSPRRTEASS